MDNPKSNLLPQLPQTASQYRKALSLGGTKILPELYEAAGAELSFDRDTLKDAVGIS